MSDDEDELGQDAPVKRGPRGPEKTAKRGASDQSRTDRATQNRATTERRDLSDAQRIAEFESKFMESVLPTLPVPDGFHPFWASTTHQQQTIASLVRLGYRPMKKSDVPGWDLAGTIGTGEYAGCIGMKEMIAFMLPLELYQAYMEINHHKRPLQEEEKLKANLSAMNETARTKGGAVLGVGDGFDNFGKKRETPDFTDPRWRPENQHGAT